MAYIYFIAYIEIGSDSTRDQSRNWIPSDLASGATAKNSGIRTFTTDAPNTPSGPNPPVAESWS